jgi:hypothetical protein
MILTPFFKTLAEPQKHPAIAVFNIYVIGYLFIIFAAFRRHTMLGRSFRSRGSGDILKRMRFNENRPASNQGAYI